VSDNYSDITPKEFVTNAADTSASPRQVPQRENAREYEAALQHLDNEIFRLLIKRERELDALRAISEGLAKQNFELLKETVPEY